MLLSVYANILSNLVVTQYFNECRCLLIFTDGHPENLAYQGTVPSVKIMTTKGSADFGTAFQSYGCQGILIQSNDAMEVFLAFEKQIRLGLERFNERRYLLVFKESKLDLTLGTVPEEFAFVVDLLLMVPEENGDSFALLSHKYTGATNSNKLVLVDRWLMENQSFVYNNDLYPDKLTNQEGRPLRMATFTYEPYSIVGNSAKELYGSELSTAFHFALKHNMTPVPVVNEFDYWGDIFSNGSGNGLLGNLLEDNADVGFAALYTWEFCYHHLDLSKPMVRTGITCLVPAPKLAGGWLTPLFSYTPTLWIFVGVLVAFGILTMTAFKYLYYRNPEMRKAYHNKQSKSTVISVVGKSLFQVGKPLLMQSVTRSEIPTELNTKLIMVLMLMFSLFLTSTYSSGLASIMTLPRYEGAINTVKDFADSGIYWGATQNAWITSIQKAEEPEYVEIVSRFIPRSEEELREFSRSRRFAFSIERLPFENFAIGTYIRKDVIANFRLMMEDLYWEQCVMMTRKSSVLLPSLNNFILRAFEAGLISKWQSKAVNLFMDNDVQKAVWFFNNHFTEHTVEALKWTHVEGAFGVLAMGYTASFIVFLFELLKFRVGRQSN